MTITRASLLRPGASVAQVNATDRDGGEMGRVSYEIVSVTPETSLFTLDPDSG